MGLNSNNHRWQGMINLKIILFLPDMIEKHLNINYSNQSLIIKWMTRWNFKEKLFKYFVIQSYVIKDYQL